MLLISLAILGSAIFSSGMLRNSKKLIIFLFLLDSMESLRPSVFSPQR